MYKAIALAVALYVIPLSDDPNLDYTLIATYNSSREIVSQPLTLGEEYYDEEHYCSLDVISCGNSPEINYEKKELIGEFTAYTPSPDETWGNPFITADGTDKREYVGCIVAHKTLPFNTEIYVPYLDTICTIKDRMPQKSKADFDIFMDTKPEAFSFGRRKLTYYELR
jgi:3D (Asp-Asp-Asp) domain-containing protein